MNKLHTGFVIAAIILSGSSATLAQTRKLTDQDRLQMQKELAWDRQQKLRADRDARTTYTERCDMVAGRLGNCQGSQPANKPQARPMAAPQTRTSVPVTDSKVGTAYGNPSVAGQPGYTNIKTYNSKPNNAPTVSSPGFYGRSYIMQ